MSSVAQLLRQAEALKSSLSDTSKTISETWVSRQRLEDIYKKVLLTDLEYALDKKVEQELWNHAFKNQINILQSQAKDKQNDKRAEIQATLNLFLETASGFYLQFLQLLCTTFKLDLPFRRKSAFYGVMKEKSPLKLKVTPPKKSSCLYVCQHCLVHLGDIARYRQQIDQAQTYYWHAAYLLPFNGQPYNQLAILEAAKGNKLSTVFYYIRSLAVKVPFSVAATNLEKLYAKLTKEIPKFKGRLSASEMITGFLQFHALVHLCTDLSKARELSEKLATGLPAHVTSQSFPWQVLVHIVAINIFAMHHIQHLPVAETGLTNGEAELTDDEETCFNFVFTLTVNMLDILLQYTPKHEGRVAEYFTLPAVKLLLDWLKLNPQNFSHTVLKQSPLWSNLCKVLNSLQTFQAKWEEDISKYEDLPLPEDVELRCFQPIEKAHSSYSYSKLPAEGLGWDIEAQLRCHRLLELGKWIMAEQPNVGLTVQTGKLGQIQFTSPTPPPQPKLTKTVTLSLPSTHVPESHSMGTTAPSPERKSNRQNVAIQAIMQKQLLQDREKVKPNKEEPVSPKYLLGVPTSEPQFFKSAGGRQSQSTETSPQGQNGKSPSGQQGGVLVLKNQEHLTRPGSQQPSQNKSWTQQRQGNGGSSWQQKKVSPEIPATWQNNQPSTQPQGQQPVQGHPSQQGQGQPSPWQQHQQQNSQMSPQAGQGQWQFPGQQNFGRPEFRARMPIQSGVGPSNMMGNSQSPYLPFAANRPKFPQPPKLANQDQYDNNLFNKSMGENMSGGMPSVPMTRPPGFAHSNNLLQINQPENAARYQSPRMANGDGMGAMPFSPGYPSMFPRQRHPNPGFPLPHNFSTPPPEHSIYGNQSTNPGHPGGQRSIGGMNLTGSGFMGNNFAQAPGMERPQGGREQQPQTPPQMYGQNQFMGPLQGMMGLTGNHMKSPLDGLFKSRFPQEEITPNMAEIIGTLSKMAIQPMRENVLPQTRAGPSSFQGHAEGTPKPESLYSSQRSSSVPAVNLDLDGKKGDVTMPVNTNNGLPSHHQQSMPPTQPQGTYSLFSSSPWLSSADTKSMSSSPFSSESSSIRNSPDPSSDTFNNDMKANQVFEMGLRFGGGGEERMSNPDSAPFFQNNMQALWSSNQAQSPLERLLEQQKQRHTDPH